MTRIPPKLQNKPSGGYSRIFGNERMGDLMSKVHSASIRSGNQLEQLITERVKSVDDLDLFLDNEIMPDGVFLATKRQIKTSAKINSNRSEPDFMIFKRRKGSQHCHVIELKDGYSFDAKKAAAECKALNDFVEHNARHLPYRILTHFCAFNESDRTVIWQGFKRKIKREEAMTGREFCELLEISYDEIVRMRTEDNEYNTRYFITELLKIDTVRSVIESELKQSEQR